MVIEGVEEIDANGKQACGGVGLGVAHELKAIAGLEEIGAEDVGAECAADGSGCAKNCDGEWQGTPLTEIWGERAASGSG